jgi:hypothetical protein
MTAPGTQSLTRSRWAAIGAAIATANAAITMPGATSSTVTPDGTILIMSVGNSFVTTLRTFAY